MHRTIANQQFWSFPVADATSSGRDDRHPDDSGSDKQRSMQVGSAIDQDSVGQIQLLDLFDEFRVIDLWFCRAFGGGHDVSD